MQIVVRIETDFFIAGKKASVARSGCINKVWAGKRSFAAVPQNVPHM